jgi:trimethylamine--corrinoid protein Co-methyltransferase
VQGRAPSPQVSIMGADDDRTGDMTAGTPDAERSEVFRTAPLDEVSLDRIHEQAMRILEDIGTEVHSDSMLRMLQEAGQRVEGTRVRWDAGFVLEQLGKVPPQFTLQGRDPRHTVTIGGGSLVHTPTGGSPFVSDADRGRRDGDLESYVELVKMAHASNVLPVLQSGTTEAQDLSDLSRHLEMDYAILRWSGRPFILYGATGPRTRDGLALAAIAAGGKEALLRQPAVIGIVNPNSPLVWDTLMVEELMALAELGQPVAITPFLLAGASAPVTLAGGLSLLVAETLSGVAMAQLVRPGTPCVLGTFLNGVDMRSGGPSLGLPESVLATLAGAQLARRYGLPLRGGGGLCSGLDLDMQTATESTMSLWATYLAECDLVVHAAGWVEGGLVASFEKLAVDLEVIAMFERIRRGITVDDGQLAYDVIEELGPGGLFLAHEHTLEHFRTESFMSPLFRSQAHPTWVKLGSPSVVSVATERWKQLLDSYEDPGIDQAVDAELRSFIERRARDLEA